MFNMHAVNGERFFGFRHDDLMRFFELSSLKIDLNLNRNSLIAITCRVPLFSRDRLIICPIRSLYELHKL